MNYEFKGTPGEWNVDGYDTVSVIAKVNEVGWRHVCKCDYGYASPLQHLELNKANAHLIAAAPALLKRCIDMVDALCGDQECEDELKKCLGIPVFNQMLLMKETIHSALNLPTT